MKKTTLLAAASALVLCPLLSPAVAEAQTGSTGRYSFMGSALVGIGGGLGEDDVSASNTTFQLGFGMITQGDIRLGLRLGSISFDSEDRVGDLSDFGLTFVTVGGEYLISEGYYTSGIYLALGGYQLDATSDLGGDADESTVGVALGLTGEFDVSERWVVRLEVSGHALPSTEIETMAMGLIGVGYRF